MTQCKPRTLTNSIKADVRRFYADEAGRCPCVVTGTRYGDKADIAHLDDDKRHSYRHNLVPLHWRYNRHFGGLMGNYGSPTKTVVPCEFTELDWENLRWQAHLHRQQWSFRRAYACVRVGYYTITRYYGCDLERLYEVMAECLYFARHVWDDDLLWALLDHDLLPLLDRDTRSLQRAQVAPVVRHVAALWTDLREVTRASMILNEHDVLLGAARDSADRKTQCSILRRRGMDAVTRKGLAGLLNGASFAKEAFSLARTIEEQVNALEIEPWLAQDRDNWPSARKLLEEEGLVPRVRPLIKRFAYDLQKQRTKRTLDTAPLKIPPNLTPLNAAQVPMDYAVSILKTGGRSKRELSEVRSLIEMSMAVYGLMGTQPFMLTENVKTAYEELGRAIGDKRLQVLAAGRCLCPQTVEILTKVSKLAVDRLRDAKS